jgi:CYTH domain-containing protein
MKLEIERKFLLKSMPDIDPDEVVQIDQWYWKNKEGVWERVRTWFSNGNERWIHTIKKSISKGVNIEDEKDISKEDYNKFVEICNSPKSESRFISKKRYIYNHGDLKWEVDKFENGYFLIIAEIEIPKKNFQISFPDYINNIILLEVTGMKQFSNRNLSIRI